MIWRSLPFALLLVLAACGERNDKPADNHTSQTQRPASADVSNQWKFEVKSGIIDMKAMLVTPVGPDSGKAINSTIKTYFDDYGSKMSVDWVVGPGDTMHTIVNDGFVINYNLKEGTGIRMRAAPQIRNGMPHLHDEIAMEEIRKRPSYRDLGTKEILGLEATGFSLDSGGTTATVWQWKRVPLYMEGKGRINTVYEVTKLETDVTIPADRFIPPSAVKVTDLEQGAAAVTAPNAQGGPKAAPPEKK